LQAACARAWSLRRDSWRQAPLYRPLVTGVAAAARIQELAVSRAHRTRGKCRRSDEQRRGHRHQAIVRSPGSPRRVGRRNHRWEGPRLRWGTHNDPGRMLFGQGQSPWRTILAVGTADSGPLASVLGFGRGVAGGGLLQREDVHAPALQNARRPMDRVGRSG
jgi:hypothetical protein